MDKYKYKISVIIPIYKVEEYIEETIKSVINQTIGFEKNIQLILVNDGSPDNSEAICLKYKELYPNNIIYIKKENGGVSSARNEGLKRVEGEFTTMLDSDDLWTPNSFKEIYEAIINNPTVNVFSCKMIFFDGEKGNHPLNYKYKEDKVVDILKDYDYPQLSTCCAFVRSSVYAGHRFDETVKFGEDNKLINEIILNEGKYMVLKKPTYLYRKRQNGLSAIQSCSLKDDWYFVTPKVDEYLFNLSKEIYGKVIKYIQNLVCYELVWRVPLNKKYDMKGRHKEYIKIIDNLVNDIDEDVIINSRLMPFDRCIYLLSKKDKNIYDKISFEGDKVLIDGVKYKDNKTNILVIDQIYVRKNKIYFYGTLDLNIIKKKDFKVLVNNKELDINYYELLDTLNVTAYDGKGIHNYVGVSFIVNADEKWNLKFVFKDKTITPNFNFGTFLSEGVPKTYHTINKMTIIKKDGLIINQRKNVFKSIYYELCNDFYLLSKGKIKSCIIRVATKFFQIFKRRDLWFISDRLNKADDNGEHFFKYLVENHKNENVYYVLNKGSSDFERLSKIGKVINYKSLKYKLMFGAADYVVSSHAETYVYNPRGSSGKDSQDLYHFKYIFLQHGITQADLSPWLNVNSKKMDMIVATAKPEYESFLKCKYYYGKDVVKLTGMPRYDGLKEKQKKIKPEKSIMLSFTWRNSLALPINITTGEREYSNDFKKSDYYKMLNGIMNDKKLLEALRKNNYKIRFIPHPNLKCQLSDFNSNDCVEIVDENFNYQDEFCKNKILVTDQSSVFFDFAYLEKPVVYFRFDEEEFYKGQVYDKGYFDYDKDGFGPVYREYDKFIDGLIKLVESDGKLDDKYAKRIDKFFKYKDQKNCERVYNEIKKI